MCCNMSLKIPQFLSSFKIAVYEKTIKGTVRQFGKILSFPRLKLEDEHRFAGKATNYRFYTSSVRIKTNKIQLRLISFKLQLKHMKVTLSFSSLTLSKYISKKVTLLL